MRAFLIVLGLTLPSLGAAQSSDVTGTWNVTWDSGLRTNGAEVIQVTRRIPSELRLVQRGDSVSGTWVMPVPIGGSAERVVTGMVRGTELQLESEVRPMDVNGLQVPMRFTWTGVLAEGDMRGTMFMQIEGRDAPPRRWEAQRQ
jgi:autotransporter translocation and assembly factor TamB